MKKRTGPRKQGRGLRVIAGEAGGLRLVAPAGIRPTTDRAREALFASLGSLVDGVAVLDLYAGSGALGIEALSRGAAVAVLVDQHRDAAEACSQNLESTHLAPRGRVHATPVTTFLRRGPAAEAPFSLVLCDPPYESSAGEVTAVLDLLAEPGWLAPDAVVVVERRAGGPHRSAPEAWPAERPAEWPPEWPGGWNVRWERKYGDTLLSALAAPQARSDEHAGVGP